MPPLLAPEDYPPMGKTMTPEEERLLSDLLGRLRAAPRTEIDHDADAMIARAARERPDLAYMLAQTVLMQDFALRDAQARIAELERHAAAPRPPRAGSFLGGLAGRGGFAGQGGYAGQGGHAGAGYGTAGHQAGHHGSHNSGPWGPPPYQGGRGGYGHGYGHGFGTGFGGAGGGGFLRSAAATAAGVVGGALLLNSLQDMFGPDVVAYAPADADAAGADQAAGVQEAGHEGGDAAAGFADDPGADPGADAGSDPGLGDMGGGDMVGEDLGGGDMGGEDLGGDFGGDEWA
ncbi:MAG TPA: DUF2076 family protein [Azospirillaceae bacterium]|nr:DUF2076 family protein [Azospirillaceae bacterium]